MTDKKPEKKKTLKDLKKILPSQTSQLSVPESESSPRIDCEDNPLLFEKEMERLGVIQTNVQDGTGLPPDISAEEQVLVEKPESSSKENLTDGELFLSSLKNFDKTFTEDDYTPQSEESSSRRSRKLRKRRFVPEKELDLHGLTRQEALRKVHFFLENASYEGLKTVLIITGAGHGSEGEAVLRGVVENFLDKESRLWVSSWERAPRKLGGEGAIAVFLRRKPE